MKKKLISLLLLFFSLELFSQSDVKNYGGRRIPRIQSDFHLVAINIEERTDSFAIISLFFNDALNAASVTPEKIYINDTPLAAGTKFTFNKNQKSFRFSIAVPEKDFTILINGINSWNDRKMNLTRLKVSKNSVYRYSPETKLWQKS